SRGLWAHPHGAKAIIPLPGQYGNGLPALAGVSRRNTATATASPTLAADHNPQLAKNVQILLVYAFDQGAGL
ncbi:MAG TPA: hypothetical protein VLC52_02540, partial [Anaerolineae bacterium]|nr:hypothetical protein [Anaerolineae bacterium]